MKYTIYQTTNIINQKYYIGAHQTEDIFDKYLGSGVALKSAIKKHSKESFDKLTLGSFKSKEIMFLIESWIVTEEVVKDKDSYNMKIGGFGGWTQSQESRKYRNLSHQDTISNMNNEQRKDAFGRDTSCDKNGKALKINIYDECDNIIFKCHGNFKSTCKDNNLPYDSLKKSYQSSKIKRLYTNMRDCDLTRTLSKYKDWFDNYKGWYAMKA